jgi:hypothetical protein
MRLVSMVAAALLAAAAGDGLREARPAAGAPQPNIQAGAAVQPTIQPGAAVQPSIQAGAAVQPTIPAGAAVQPNIPAGAAAQPSIQAGAAVQPSIQAGAAAQYTASGELRRPEGYRKWVFVGASLGLSYAEGARAEGMDEFHHVYLRPEAYDEYRHSGRFPDKTVLVLELHAAEGKAAPARHGLFEGRRVALEAAVKDVERFPEQWAYFSFGDGSRETAAPLPRARCFDCHHQHAAADNVFIQFYPVLRDGAH